AAFENDVDEPVELGLGHFDERLRREDTGVVEKHIETAETGARALHDRFTGRRQSDVAYVHSNALARRVNLPCSRLGFGGIATVNHDRTAFRDEADRNLLAKMSATAPLTAFACGNGRGSGSSWKGR